MPRAATMAFALALARDEAWRVGDRVEAQRLISQRVALIELIDRDLAAADQPETPVA